MALQHGETGTDDLLKCYANTPYAKLFKATQQLTDFFKPFLDAFSPNDALAYYGRGRAYGRKGDLDNALSDVMEAIRLNPQFADAYRCRGKYYNGKYGE